VIEGIIMKTSKLNKMNITKTDLIVSLFALSQANNFPCDREFIGSKLKGFFSKGFGRLPKLDLRIIDDVVYCDDFDDAFNQLQFCGMILIQNPMFRHYRVTNSLKQYFEKNVKPNLSADEISYLETVAYKIWGDN
jgi:hypothetical protein